MMFPPSLHVDVLARAFRASNGELGIVPIDADPFLRACEADRVGVLGWELWLIDHCYDLESGKPRLSPGHWCGLIPTVEDGPCAVVGGQGEGRTTKDEIAALKLDELVDAQWLSYVRYNFTLDG
jgi:hypothetical protein